MGTAPARILRLALCATMACAAAGCAARAVGKVGGLFKGQNETVLESDVAAPPEMESRYTTGIEHQGETLVGGTFVFRGPLDETDAFATEIRARYTERGWQVARTQVTPTEGRMLFRKDAREVSVDFRANLLNPAMSQATVTVKRLASAPQPAQSGGGGGAT